LTTTNAGLTVNANLDEKIYLTGIKITEEQKKKLNIVRNDFHGEWNFIIRLICKCYLLTMPKY